jgi:hypothetical protein
MRRWTSAWPSLLPMLAAAVALADISSAAGVHHARSNAGSVAPTPNGPVYDGVPGALPGSFHAVYNDGYHGWPIRPLHSEHPVRGSFLDPRGKDDTGLSGYHFGIDISVDERHPEAGAPGSFSQRVYAVESGVASVRASTFASRCFNRRVEVGHFAYWHVSPTVTAGQRVKAGQPIGWSCRGAWHIHLSEWQRFRGRRVWVNPLRGGGPLSPYTDSARPRIGKLTFYTPPSRPWRPTTSLVSPDSSLRVPSNALHGPVELRATINDPQSFLGFLARKRAWPTAFTPYRVAVRIQARNGRVVMDRISFQADQLPQTPYIVHYAPGTVEDDNMKECVGPPALAKCSGMYRFRPFSRFREEFWDTSAVPNGIYRVTIIAFDLRGNRGARGITVTVKNAHSTR